MSHINYHIDFTVEVFIVSEDKVLLRKHDKYKKWLSVGGHIEQGEDPVEAAYREVKEETGLSIEIVPTASVPTTDLDRYTHLIPPAFMNRHSIKGEHEHVTFVYFARALSTTITQGEDEQSEACEWFSREDLENPENEINETIKLYANEALNRTKNKD